MSELPRLLTIEEVAEMLGVNKAAIMSWMETKEGFPSAIRLTSRLIRFDQSEVLEFIQRSPEMHFLSQA